MHLRIGRHVRPGRQGFAVVQRLDSVPRWHILLEVEFVRVKGGDICAIAISRRICKFIADVSMLASRADTLRGEQTPALGRKVALGDRDTVKYNEQAECTQRSRAEARPSHDGHAGRNLQGTGAMSIGTGFIACADFNDLITRRGFPSVFAVASVSGLSQTAAFSCPTLGREGIWQLRSYHTRCSALASCVAATRYLLFVCNNIATGDNPVQ